MNYLKQYKKLVGKAQKLQEFRKMDKKLGGYYERHHIIPECELIRRGRPNHLIKCTNNQAMWNIVMLTAKEHFLAHILLWRGCEQKYGESHYLSKSMCHAANYFVVRKFQESPETKISSKIYEMLKKKLSKNMSIRHSNKTVSAESIEKISSKMRHTWEIERSGGRTDVTQNLKQWCIDNGYALPSMYNFGKHLKKYRDIVKIIKLTDDEKERNRVKNNWMKGRTGGKHPKAKKYIIYFEDNRIIEIYSLKEWCTHNKYNLTQLYDLIKGKRSSYKDIIKVIICD